METNPLDEYRRELLERYRGQVRAYRDHLATLAEGGLHAPIQPGEWSAHQVLFHVTAVDAQAYGPRLERILKETRPDLDDFDETAWMAAHYDPQESAEALLDAWETQRDHLADLLAGAPVQAWNRTGTQPYWGERTLQWWLERSVTHAEDHWAQLHGE